MPPLVKHVAFWVSVIVATVIMISATNYIVHKHHPEPTVNELIK